jgi:hypothetical protein
MKNAKWVMRDDDLLCRDLSLTPRFNAVPAASPKKNRFKRFFSWAALDHPAETGC